MKAQNLKGERMNIDGEIAERVMGWEFAPEGTIINGQPTYGAGYPYHDGRSKCFKPANKWHPSTNIQHAMEVEAEMCRKGFRIIIQHYVPEGEWFVMFTHSESDFDVVAPTLPEAICLAALEALK